jgi:hypothetical protein
MCDDHMLCIMERWLLTHYMINILIMRSAYVFSALLTMFNNNGTNIGKNTGSDGNARCIISVNIQPPPS